MPREPPRGVRWGTNQEEIHAKRLRGELSCAECKRSKLKCDKQIPCGSCKRRGCEKICPNGALAGSQGSKHLFADTEELRKAIAEMSHRIHLLEDALETLHASQASTRHPLLTDNLKAIKYLPEKRNLPQEQPPSNDEITPISDALGTLSVTDTGDVKYYGQSAGSERILSVTAGWEPFDDDTIAGFLPPSTCTALHDLVWDSLPSQMRAWSLCEAYFENGQFFIPSIMREEAVDILVPIYRRLAQEGKPPYPPTSGHNTWAHKLSLLYMVLAIGALMDFTLPPNNPEAAKYSQLGRAALSLRSVAENPQIETIQTLALLGGYRHMAGGKACIDSAWSYASFSIKLAQSVGLHRDCALWGLDTKTVQRRRLTFWSMAATEIFFALHTGRPPSCSLSYVDCEFPIYDGQNSTKDEAATQLFKLWHFRSLKEWIIPACQHMMAVPGPNYQSLLALERKMLQETPPSFEFLTDPDTSGRPSREARSYIMSLLRVNTMMYIHRSFFAQAILDKPDNPFLSPYAHSYLTAYRCASTQLSVSLHFYNKCPLFFQRLTPFWTNAFTAALIVGFVVSRTPHVWLAKTAFVDFGNAMAFFESVASKNARACKSLMILRKLKDKAYSTYSQSQERIHLTDDLAVFGGRASVIPVQTQPDVQLDLSEQYPSAPLEFDVSPVASETGTDGDTMPLFPEIVSLQLDPTVGVQPELQAQGTWLSEQEDLAPGLYPIENVAAQMSVPDGFADDIGSADGLPEYGQSAGEGVMEGQWASLLRDAGLLEPSQGYYTNF